MGQYNKSIVAPIVGVVCLVLLGVFGVDIGSDLQGQIVEWIGYGITIAVSVGGIFKNHK